VTEKQLESQKLREVRSVLRGVRAEMRRLRIKRTDLLPNLPSFIRRVCSGYAPDRGVLRTQLVLAR
jgi:hypothetical protein